MEEKVLRPLGKIIESRPKRLGNFQVRTPFSDGCVKEIDPFLMLDHLAPGFFKGSPDQKQEELPHIGFEMMTYLLEGTLEYQDDLGTGGVLEPGDLQWVTAGRGLVHPGNPKRINTTSSANLHALHLWVNLPRNRKNLEPAIYLIRAALLPAFRLPKVYIRLLAGEWNGKVSPLNTQVPVIILHLILEPDAQTEINLPVSFNCGIYVIRGSGLLGEEELAAAEGKLVIFNRGGRAVRIKSHAAQGMQVLLLAGEPIGEPIAAYGSLVLNSVEEVSAAMVNYWSRGMSPVSF